MTGYNMDAIPGILFAHRFTSDEYHGVLPPYGNRIEITVVTSGSISLTVNGKRETAERGDICCNFFRYETSVDTDRPHSHHTVCFAAKVDECSGDALFHTIPLVIKAGEYTAECLRIIDDIIREFTLYPDDKLKVSGLFLQLLGVLDGIGKKRGGVSPADMLYAKKAKEYIYDHIYEKFTQKDVAAHLGITPEYLCTVFKRASGVSIIRFCNNIKLDGVRTLMETKGLTLYQACLQYGFSDPDYVSRLYKKYNGISITDAVRFHRL